jgi:hypothetical protein
MTKTVTHIDCPKEWESINDWDSHRELLWVAATHTHGTIAEFGCGFGSTLLLKDYCNNNGLKFKSFDTDAEWAKKMGSRLIDCYITGKEEFCLPEIFKPLLDIRLLLIDSKPGDDRKNILKAYANLADVIVIHDTEIGAEYVYGLSPILSTFKYRLDYQPEGKPHTTVVSNFVNVTEWI